MFPSKPKPELLVSFRHPSGIPALRFFFTVTLDRPDLARRLTVVPYPRRIPTVLSVEEVRLLLQAASAPKYKAAFGTPADFLRAKTLSCWHQYLDECPP